MAREIEADVKSIEAWRNLTASDKGMLADLRRCTSWQQAFYQPGFYSLLSMVAKSRGYSTWQELESTKSALTKQLAVIAILSAHCKKEQSGKAEKKTAQQLKDQDKEGSNTLAGSDETHVKGPKLGQVLGKGTGAHAQPLISELRFKNYLSIDTEDIDGLLTATTRFVKQLKDTVPFADLARKILTWGDDTKFSLAKEYFGYASTSQNSTSETK